MVAFLLVHAIPGGPFDTGLARPPEATRLLEDTYHLNEPLAVQYTLYLSGLVKGDLGESLVNPGVTATEVIADRLPTSAALGLAALSVAFFIGVPVGILAAVRHRRKLDYVVMVGASLGYAIPNFVLSLVLILLFGLWLGWLPLGGWGGIQHAILPAIALGLPWAGLIARLMRATMLENLDSDHVLIASAKGLTRSQVVRRHAVRNSWIPVVTVAPLLIAELITGSIVVESVFGIPGMGQYVVQSVTGRDYLMMLGFVVFYATLIVVANLLADIFYGWLDPRIRVGG